MGVATEVQCTPSRLMPGVNGVVAQRDPLVPHVTFCEFFHPPKLICVPWSHAVIIAEEKVDVEASDSLAEGNGYVRASHAEVAQIVEFVVRLD